MKKAEKVSPKKAAKKTDKKVVKLPLKKKPTLEQRVSMLELKDNLTADALEDLWKVLDGLDDRVFVITVLGCGIIILTFLFLVSIIR